MKALHILTLFCWIFYSAPTLSQTPNGSQEKSKANFSGDWTLNVRESKLEIPNAPVKTTVHIHHEGNSFELRRTHVYADDTTDEVQAKFEIGAPMSESKVGRFLTRSRLFWEGDALVLDQQITTDDNKRGSNHVQYTLLKNGMQLLALETEEYPGGKFTNRWVFDRKRDDK